MIPVHMKRSLAEHRAIEAANQTTPKAPLIRCTCGRAIDAPKSIIIKDSRKSPTWLAVMFGLVLGISARECMPQDHSKVTKPNSSYDETLKRR